MIEPVKLNPDSPKEVRIYPKGLEAMGVIERPHLGMKMYAVDQRTRECTEAKYKTVSLPQVAKKSVVPGLMGQLVQHAASGREIERICWPVLAVETHNQVIFDAGKYYVWAINKKSAVRKFVRALEAANRSRFNPK